MPTTTASETYDKYKAEVKSHLGPRKYGLRCWELDEISDGHRLGWTAEETAQRIKDWWKRDIARESH